VTIENSLGLVMALALVACAAPQGESHAPGGAPPTPTVAAAPSLGGTRWMGVIDPSIDKRFAPWLEFIAEGRVSGFTGCNLLQGGWKTEGGEVRVGPIATTKRGCTGPDKEIERRVVAALNERSRVSREGDKLVFTTPAGDRVEFVEAR
jgi:heat shock protein HslJ